ncbi:MAG: endonuclease/exonuclease/phosphatase family protein [Gaiella sp.]
MSVLLRTWNVFHGNTYPPGRRSHLAEMVRLVTEDHPDVVCLQEVPVWALPRLEEWSGMSAFTSIARGPRLPRVSGPVTRVHNGALRSLVSGQANAMLVDPRHEARALGSVGVSRWGKEPRRVHAVWMGGLVIANTHLSSPADSGAQQEELERCVAFLDRFADGGPVVLAGDLNVSEPVLPGFTGGGPGIDHVLVRGLELHTLEIWEPERRVRGRRLLSDHAPVETVIT